MCLRCDLKRSFRTIAFPSGSLETRGGNGAWEREIRAWEQKKIMKTIVMIPTYNERENISPLLQQVLEIDKDIGVLVVDDNSPDGTWRIVEDMSEKEPRVHLLRRMKKRGRGTAGIDGLRYALEKGADYIIEMDADFSHNPKYIPELLRALEKYDVAIGSRFIDGGKDKDRGLLRRLITKAAGMYVRMLLGIKIKDVSSGFRCFRREVLEKIDLDDMVSGGPSIVLELLYKITLNGCSIKEVPIIFEDRRQGKTKLDWITLLETMVMVLRLRKMKKDGLIKTGTA